MIIFDTETTGLVKPYAVPLSEQPQIIEFAALRLADKKPYKVIETIEFLVYPGVDLPEIITKITGLIAADLIDKGRFAARYEDLAEFFLGERYLIGHNVKFDVDLLRFELMRMGKESQFPWPPTHICTVNSSMRLRGHRLKQEELLEFVTKKKKTGAHRAMADVKDLETIVRWMIKQEMIEIG